MKEAPSTLPTPLPLPPPPLETTAVHLPMRRRVRQKAATSPAITSSQSSLSSSPTNSSSSGSSSSSIPFSWEHQPGIPKTPNASETLSLPLPLPPSRHGMGIVVTPRSGSGSGTPLKPVSDPFVTALPECAKEGFEKCGKVGTGTASHVQRRLIKAGRPLSVPAITGWFALLDLYGCKTAISVVDSAVSLPQAARRVGTYRVVSRQKPRTDRRRADQNQKASV